MPTAPLWQTAYEQALNDARSALFDPRTGLAPDAIRRLYATYADALVRIYTAIERGTLNSQQLQRQSAIAQAIVRELARLSSQLGNALDSDTMEIAGLATEGHAIALAAAAEAVGVELTTSFAAVPERALRAMMVRRGFGQATTFQTLVNRRIKDAAAEVDVYVGSAFARGVGADRAVKDLAIIMAREDPTLLAAVRRLGPRGGRLVSEIAIGAPVVPPDQVASAKSLFSDARRIYVSETNTAFMEADRLAAVESPVVDVMEWQTSGRHEGLPTSPDECDVYELADLHGLGPGVYYPETLPARPHPNCGCTTRTKTRRPSQWNEPKRTPLRPSNLSSARVREIFGKGASDTRVARARSTINERLHTAHEVWQKSG